MNITFYLHDEKDFLLCEQRLLWLKKHFTLISTEEVRALYYERKKVHKVCHITIDDGWLSTYQVIFPLLKKYNIPASVFVSPLKCKEESNFWFSEFKGYDEALLKDMLINKDLFAGNIRQFPMELIFKEMKIDEVCSILNEYRNFYSETLKERDVVNVQELIEMDRSGLVEIGAHTMTHPILANESDERAEREIKDSVSQLSELLDRRVTTFAYPNGLPDWDFGKREMEIAKECGIDLAFSVNPGVMDVDKTPLAIPRTCSLQRIKLGGWGLRLPSLHDQIRLRKQIRKYKLYE